MFDVVIEQEIAAAHQLRGYQGKCERFHGHNWKVQLEVSSNELDECGLALDFGVLKSLLNEVLEKYDHTALNELPAFQSINPTSENLAKTIYQECREKLASYKAIAVKTVSVWESSRSFVRYYEN